MVIFRVAATSSPAVEVPTLVSLERMNLTDRKGP